MASPALATVVPENSIRFLGHPTHEHDEPHLVYMVTGRGTLVVGDEPLELRAQQAVWMAPHVPHSMRMHDGGVALGPMLEPHVSPASGVRDLGVLPELVEVMTTIVCASPHSEDQIAAFRAAIGRVLLAVDDAMFSAPLPVHPVGRAVAQEAARLPLTLDQLAARRRISVRQLQRIFLDETGMTFVRWRSRARLNTAVSRMLGGVPASNAARSAGYATKAGLLRALSRESGVPVDQLTRDVVGTLHELRRAG